MKWCLVETATGRIGPFGHTFSQAIVDQKAGVAGPGWEARTDPPEDLDPRVTYFLNGEYVPRPVTPAPSASYGLTALPSGTTVTVRNEAGDELVITDLSETLTLSDPGTYRFTVIPPFPHTEVRTKVEVS